MLENDKFRDVFYIFFHVPLMNFIIQNGFTENKELSFKDVFIGFGRLAAKSVLALPTLFAGTKQAPFLLVSGTFNNFKTLNNLEKHLPSSYHVSIMGSHNPEPKFPDFCCYMRGLLELAALKRIYNSLSPLERRAFFRRLDVAVWVAGSSFVLKKYIERVRPDIIVLANDHSPFARAIFHTATELGVLTAYIPHAPVSKEFPPLSMDYAFLDGEVQLDLYKKGECKFEVVGAIRYENVVKEAVDYHQNGNVVVCFNKLNSLTFADNLLAQLTKLDWMAGREIFIRTHPADKNRVIKFNRIAAKYGAIMQDSSKPISQNSGIGIMFAGISGVLIDGLMLGLRLVSLKSWYHLDYYEVARHRCIELYDDIKSVPEKPVLNRQNASLFNKHLEQRQKLPSQLVASRLMEIRESHVISRARTKG